MYYKKCEVCNGVITDARRIEVENSIGSATCSVNCEQWLKAQIANCSVEQLVEMEENKVRKFGIETVLTAREELQRRRRLEQPQPPAVVQNADLTADNLRYCYECGEKSDSIKNFRVMNVFVFLIIFMVARGIDYRACPSCMRKKIATAAGIQILTAHVVFPIVLIFHIIQFCRTFVSGHSD